MKKYTLVLAIAILFVLVLSGCTVATVEETEIEATVVSCEQGQFHPHATYTAMAVKCLKEKKATLYAYYSQLAEENGTYDYVVTFEIDGQSYSVTRNEEYAPGDTFEVTRVITRQGEEILKTEYK